MKLIFLGFLKHFINLILLNRWQVHPLPPKGLSNQNQKEVFDQSKRTKKAYPQSFQKNRLVLETKIPQGCYKAKGLEGAN